MTAPPAGTYTFLFTDIQGSTKLWEDAPEAMQAALRDHDRLIREIIDAGRGHVFKTVGDAFCAAFTEPLDALQAAVCIQRAMLASQWMVPGGMHVRIGLHTGEAECRDDDYFGQTLNRVAR